MRVYKVSWCNPDLGGCCAWAASKAEAVRLLREKLDELKECFPEIEDVENNNGGIQVVTIPPGKKGLLRWLNLWLTSDNE